MKKRYNSKDIAIVVLCIGMLVMALGFSALSMKLDQYKNKSDSFNINFIDAKMISSIKGGKEEPLGSIKIDKSGNILNLDFSLFNEYDEISYEVRMQNDGTVPIKIIDLLSSPDFKDSDVLKNISPVIISISDVKGKTLEAGESSIVKISVRYGSSQLNNKKVNLKGKIGIIAETKK